MRTIWKKLVRKSLTPILMFFCLTGFSQSDKTVTGTITSSDGAPLPGATVIQKGTQNGVQSDFDGNYEIKLVSGSEILVFTYVGFAPKEESVGTRNSSVVVLQEDAQALDEVVVTGYGTQRRSDLTGSVASVKENDIAVTLLPCYADAIYIDNNAERVWAIQQTQAVEGQGTAGTFVWAGIGSTNGGIPRGQGHGGWPREFYDLYEEIDVRMDITMQYSYIHDTTGKLTFFSGQPVESYNGDPYQATWGISNNNYIDSDRGCYDGDPDIIYYRFSDALLMYAEAEISLNGPTNTTYEYLNMVRERIGATPYTPGSHSQEEFAELMFQEKLPEFTFECQELYDIHRLGKVQEVIETAPLPVAEETVYREAYEVWPIPNTEINSNNNLEQNPG